MELAPDLSGTAKVLLHSELHAICESKGRPLIMLRSYGQKSDHNGAAMTFDALPTSLANGRPASRTDEFQRHAHVG